MNNKNNFYRNYYNKKMLDLKDYGPNPLVININEATLQNNDYRLAIWTGKNLQVTLMEIKVGESIGLELHPDTEQFIRIEQGMGLVQMGDEKANLDFEKKVTSDFAVIIPAGKWHNIKNIGNVPLKLYSIYAPPHHLHGLVQESKTDKEN